MEAGELVLVVSPVSSVASAGSSCFSFGSYLVIDSEMIGKDVHKLELCKEQEITNIDMEAHVTEHNRDRVTL